MSEAGGRAHGSACERVGDHKHDERYSSERQLVRNAVGWCWVGCIAEWVAPVLRPVSMSPTVCRGGVVGTVRCCEGSTVTNPVELRICPGGKVVFLSRRVKRPLEGLFVEASSGTLNVVHRRFRCQRLGNPRFMFNWGVGHA